MIGNTYANGNLVVIGWDPETCIATVRCRCNNVEGFKRTRLVSGQVKHCRKCQANEAYAKSITVNMKLLADVAEAIAAKVLTAYARHMESCLKNELLATPFATFVREMLGDPDLGKDEPESTFEQRYASSNQQHYHVYDSPARLPLA